MRIVWLWLCGMERSSRGSGRRTSWIKTRWVWVAERPTLALLGRVGWWQSRSVWLIIRTLRTRLLTLHRLHVRRLTLLRLVHRWLLVALRWWRVLPTLLRLSVRVTLAVLRKWLTVCAVELCVGWWVLAAPDRMRWDEGLSLGTDWCEDALL